MDKARCENQTLFSFDTELTADTVECCRRRQFFACGTYQLKENSSEGVENSKKQVRVGSISLYGYSKISVEDNSSDQLFVTHQKTLTTSGILDMKWKQSESDSSLENNYIYTATSDGKMEAYKLEENEGDTSTEWLFLNAEVDVEKDGLCLSLDCIDSAKFVVSTYHGHIAITENTGTNITLTSSWKGHDFEAWICAADRWNPDVVYSGGDDCKFKTWDLRAGPKCMTTNRAHEMGVCSIQSHPLKEALMCTGSYDESIRFWDKRNMKLPISSLETGGGVWRLKWHPNKIDYLLAACMHGGFKVFEIDEAYTHGTVVTEYQNHQSLAYGADWLTFQEPVGPSTTVATCSFYDHSLHVWVFLG